MRTSVFCGLAALTASAAVLSGCSSSRSASFVLADSELRLPIADGSLASSGDWRMTGDSVGLWLLDSASGDQSPMVFAFAADGSPEFIAGDSLGMLLVTGDITAIATVLESTELD